MESNAMPPPVALLLADDDPTLRFLFATLATQAVEGLTVLEAADGAQAVRIAAEHRPPLALLDVQMPLVDGIDAALALREVQAETRIALFTVEPDLHRRRAHEHGFPLFDKLDVDRPIRWVELQLQALAASAPERAPELLQFVGAGRGA